MGEGYQRAIPLEVGFTESLGRFVSPEDEVQLRALDDLLRKIQPEKCGEIEFSALLGVFERFPEHDGFGIFWIIVHCLEACDGYERALIQSVARYPCEFNVLMVGRILNSGVREVSGDSLLLLLESACTHPMITKNVQVLARNFIDRATQVGA